MPCPERGRKDKIWLMKLGTATVFVGLDRGSVEGGELRAGVRGARLSSYASVVLDPGALEPRPFEPNIADPEAVADAVRRVAAAIDAVGRRVVLVLPDGVARTGLVKPPGNVAADRFARFRLGQGLPYSSGESVVGTLRVTGGAHLAGVAWRKVVSEYETILGAADVEVASAELAPFLALSGLETGRQHDGLTVDAILGAAAFSLAVWDRTGLRLFRNRRRGVAPEIERVADEIARTAALVEGRSVEVRAVGQGARELLSELGRRGIPAERGWNLAHDGLDVEPFELVWCGVAA